MPGRTRVDGWGYAPEPSRRPVPRGRGSSAARRRRVAVRRRRAAAGALLLLVVGAAVWWGVTGPRARADATLKGPGLEITAGRPVGVPGSGLIGVEVEVRNRGRVVRTFTPLDLALRGPDGEVYQAYVPTSGDEPTLPGGALEPGQSLRGRRTFEVPTDAEELTLLYQADGMESAVEARLPGIQVAVDQPASEAVAQLP